ncbi:hypothetical protein HWV23_02690 [Natronomonas halophila]|uniref:hypothetical protein n=1 Tax=Natronomonas halophila TaxID=2747817 RepID=UPI0015B4BE15|nr:hypothetical protein [Natronomonas halophila]QLD84607.1 hypothetical protein HWV23_02405 [Natronomonas halophila]QLD84663.1 hypothetical protein HWV23_02690 [Natronomonas halophila]
MRFSNVIMAYFVIGAVMWGGGAIAWTDAGVAELFVDNPDGDEASANSETAQALEEISGPIKQAASTIGGAGLLAVLGLLTSLFGYLFWPLTTLIGLGAPLEISLLFGGSLTCAFYVSLIRVIRGSA